MSSYLTLLLVAAFVSISVYEGLVIVGIIYSFFKRRFHFWGDLRFPLIGFMFSTILPTAVFFPNMLLKSLNEGLFQVVYFIKPNNPRKIIIKLPFLLVFLGIIGLPVVLYNLLFKESVKLFWGGSFEVASFYTIFGFCSFIIGFYNLNKEKKLSTSSIFFFVLGLLFFSIVIYSARRSYLIGIPVVFLLLNFILAKYRLLNKKVFLAGLSVLFLGSAIAYAYLSTKDYRFQTFNEILLGKRSLDYETLNRISSSRYGILLDGIEIIKTDIKERRVLNLLLGHGIRSGAYLPHKRSPQNWQRYESVIFVSEFIERGVVGLLSILAIYFIAFKRFLETKLENSEDILVLAGFIPLLIHLIGSTFTFFWDALLPLFLLLFKFSEAATER